MANKSQILAKIARNAYELGLTVNSQSATQLIIEDGGTDLLIDYVDASIASPMGGVDGSVSPFLGIGIANPGKIRMRKNTASAQTIAQTFATAVSLKVLALCTRFANNVVVADSNVASPATLAEIAGEPTLLGMGQ